jgi:hypothetical protein
VERKGVKQIGNMSSSLSSPSSSSPSSPSLSLVKYRAYKKGNYFDRISERYNHIDIFELQALRIPLSMDKVNYYTAKENINEPIITKSGEDGHIIRFAREASYYYQANQGGEAAADHIVVPVELRAKRFKFASNEDLQLWEEESKEEGIVFVGLIPNIAPVREILEQSGEDSRLIHPATSDRDAKTRQMINSAGQVITEDPAFYYNYTESFSPTTGPCLKYDCPICYGALETFKPKIFILGLSEDAPLVVTARAKDLKTRKLKYLLKLAKLAQISTMSLQIADSMDTIDSPNLSEYYEEMS